MSQIDILDQGFPLTIPYVKNTEKAANFGTTYAQDIEPAGNYINYCDTDNKIDHPNYKYGEITIQNAYVIEWETTGHGGWKTKLSECFGGKTGKRLSNAIKKAGYDAIMTIDSEYDSFMEIVIL